MNRAPILIAATSLLALTACGQGDGSRGDTADNSAYDTVQPEMAGNEVDTVDVAGIVDTPSALPDAVTGDIIAIAQQAGDFTTFISVIESAGLTETLEGPGPFTVFAPTDDAFAAMPEGALDDLRRPANREKLVSLVEYHVLPARVTTGDISKEIPSPATVQGEGIALETTAEGKVMAGGANIVTADIIASNGVVHIIDKVIMPPVE